MKTNWLSGILDMLQINFNALLTVLPRVGGSSRVGYMMKHVEISEYQDLTAVGFSGDEIRTLYYTQEPIMQAIVDAAAQMNERSRYMALALIQTIMVVDATHPEGQMPKVEVA